MVNVWEAEAVPSWVEKPVKVVGEGVDIEGAVNSNVVNLLYDKAAVTRSALPSPFRSHDAMERGASVIVTVEVVKLPAPLPCRMDTLEEP